MRGEYIKGSLRIRDIGHNEQKMLTLVGGDYLLDRVRNECIRESLGIRYVGHKR